MTGKRLIIVGADYSDVSIGKLKISITSTKLANGETATLTLSAPSVTSPTLKAELGEGSYITMTGSNPYTITGSSTDGSQEITCTLQYVENSKTITETKKLTITVENESPVTSYNISTSITNGSYSGATKITQGGTATVTISANDGYKLPSSITVSGATYEYSSDTGIINLSNPTGTVNISGECKSSTGEITYDTAMSQSDLEGLGVTIKASGYYNQSGNWASSSNYTTWIIPVEANDTFVQKSIKGFGYYRCFWDENMTFLATYTPDQASPNTEFTYNMATMVKDETTRAKVKYMSTEWELPIDWSTTLGICYIKQTHN